MNQADRSGRSTGTDSRADGVGPARRVVLASVLTTFALGSIHAFSVLGAAMERHFDAERARVSVVYSVALAMLTLLVLLSPRLYRLARAPLLLGVSFAGCALGVAICVPAASLLQVVLGYGVVFGAANGLGYGLALTMAATAMPGRKGLVMCVVTASYAVGAALGAKVLGVFTGTHGPAGGFLALLVLLLVSGVAAVALAVTGGARVEGEPVSRDAAPRHARTTLVLWLAYGTAVFSGLMAIGHAAGIAQAQGASTAQYATATMLIALGNALGGLACAPLADRLPVRGVLTLLPVCSLAGLLLMRVVPGVVPAMAGLAVVGFGYGATIAAYPPAVARIVGLGAYPRVYGRVFTAWGVAGLAAAWLAGRLYDITGSYAVSLDVAGGLALASVTTVLLAGRSLKRETAVGSC